MVSKVTMSQLELLFSVPTQCEGERAENDTQNEGGK